VSILGEIGLAAAEQLEQHLGPAVALRSFKPLLGDRDARVRGAAALGTLRCALALGDRLELEAWCSFWQTQTDLPVGHAIVRHATELTLTPRLDHALMIAEAEETRRPSTRAHYLVARLLDGLGRSDDALARHRRVAEVASVKEAAYAVASRVRLLEILLEQNATFAELAPIAEALEPGSLTPAQRLVAARAQLCADSAYTRAGALSTLAELARTADPAIARAAIATAARYADTRRELSWVEVDRLGACIAHWPDEPGRELAQARLKARHDAAAGSHEPAVQRYHDLARSLAAGTPVVFRPLEDDPDPALRVAGAALNAMAALALGDCAAAATSFEALHPSHASPIPRALWSATLLALSAEDVRLRGWGRRLAEQLLARPGETPPRGFLPYARALKAAGADETAIAAYRAAAWNHEPAAAELSAVLCRRGWDAASRGDALTAASLLRSAKGFGAA
jgi:hypothetical protein